MNRRQRVCWALAFTTALAAACTETQRTSLSPDAVSFRPSKSGKQSATVARDSALSTDIVRSITVDKKGGKLEIKETGLKLTIPENALPAGTASMTITVTALAGHHLAYEFEPSGTMFRQPLQFEQAIGKQGLLAGVLQQPTVSYFTSRADIDAVNDVVVTFEDLLSNIDLSKDKVKADIWHFSGYIVAWGRR